MLQAMLKSFFASARAGRAARSVSSEANTTDVMRSMDSNPSFAPATEDWASPERASASPGHRGLPGFCPAVHPALSAGRQLSDLTPRNGEAGTLATNSAAWREQGLCHAQFL